MASRLENARQHPDSVQASLLNAVRRLFAAHGFGHTIPWKMAIDATSDFFFCCPQSPAGFFWDIVTRLIVTSSTGRRDAQVGRYIAANPNRTERALLPIDC